MSNLKPILLNALGMIFCAQSVLAQTIHLPPVFRPVLPKDEPVLSFRTNECEDEITKVGVQDRQLTVAHKSGAIDVIPLGNRKIQDILSELHTKYGDYLVGLDTDYPLLSATYLVETKPESLACNAATKTLQQAVDDALATANRAGETADEAAIELANAAGAARAPALAKKQDADAAKLAADQAVAAARQTLSDATPHVQIKANSGEPDVTIGFGVVMSPSISAADADDAEDAGLLSGAGFQLDLIGTHLFARPSKDNKHKKAIPSLYGQTRFGLHGNQELNVQGSQGAEGEGLGPQVETAIQQAQQVAATIQMPVAWALFENRMDFIATPSFGVTWTAIESFALPSVRVAGTVKAAGSLFDTELVAAVQEELNRTLPLSEFGVDGIFHIRRGDNTVYYFGAGFVRKETPQRSIEFTVAEAATPPANDNSAIRVKRVTCQTRCASIARDPVSTSLKAAFDTPGVNMWQLVFGWRMGGILDLRIDAAGPFDRKKGDPLLRVVVGRAFPIRAQ